MQGHFTCIVVPRSCAICACIALGALDFPLILPFVVHALGVISTFVVLAAIPAVLLLYVSSISSINSRQVSVSSIGLAIAVRICAIIEYCRSGRCSSSDICPFYIFGIHTIITTFAYTIVLRRVHRHIRIGSLLLHPQIRLLRRHLRTPSTPHRNVTRACGITRSRTTRTDTVSPCHVHDTTAILTEVIPYLRCNKRSPISAAVAA